MLIPVETKSGLKLSEREIEATTFKDLSLKEADVEEFLRKNIDVIFEEDETLLMVGQQVSNLQHGRSDLVALDKNGYVVLIEIKRDVADIVGRTEAFEFQAVRYAASLAKIRTPDELVEKVFAKYIEAHKDEFQLNELTPSERGKRIIAEFLKWNAPGRTFNQKQRIILIASDYDEQTLSAVAWMISNDVDIQAFSLMPAKHGSDVFLDVNRVLPPADIEDFLPDIAGISANPGVSRTSRGKRTYLPRMPELIKWGIVKKGDHLVIRNYEDSEAEVIDDKRVRFKNHEMTFNEWGSKVTGWSSICIYDWAKPKDGLRTLADLRQEKMKQMEGEKAANNDLG
jgi:hypothetical protein